MRKKRTAERPLFYRVFYLMRTMIDSTAPPTEAVTVVMPVLMGEIVPSAEMDRTLASATAQVVAASVPETLRRMDSLGLIVQSKVPFASLESVVPTLVLLRGNHNYWTLLHLKFQRHVFAEHGGNGGRDKCHGKDGKDVYIDVPCGTVVYNAETGKYVCDVTYDGQEVVLLKGGRGGLGNFQFRTATNQAPRYAQPGEPMEEMTIILELKLLADVGLVGLPNAGKSTLLSAVSSARPKIANYPFTTLEPSLGIVDYRDHKSFVMADIPGIIEGASEGKGLGLRFLRHIERNSLLLFMVPGDTDDIKREYELLKSELEKFNPEMLNKHRVLAVTKCDMLDEELIDMLRETLPDDLPVVFISSVTGQGIQELKDLLWRELNAESNKLQSITSEDVIVHRDKDMTRFLAEMQAEGEDEIEYIDEDDIEDADDFDDLDDFEYEYEEDGKND